MNKSSIHPAPPDQLQRLIALDPTRSVLVQAPAGSGKTTLLTERFLTLLAEVDEPGQVVAITFTNAASAEMRNRILDELRAPEPSPIARRVLQRSDAFDWKLLDLPAQLRISTIDSFCRDLALQQPLLSGLGGGLAIAEQPTELYRRAARHTIEQIAGPSHPEVGAAVESLLDWRDNNWRELEDLLVKMLSQRDRWMQDFVLGANADWEALRARLERPFANAIHAALAHVGELLDQVPGACDEALLLARFACAQPCGNQHRALAELAEFPHAPFRNVEALEEAHHAVLCLANLVFTKERAFRQRIDKNHGFPPERKQEKARLVDLIYRLDAIPGMEDALAAVSGLPPARYTEEDWLIVRACFTLLRHAAGELKVVFADAAAVDFIEVAQIAESVLKSDDGYPSDAALAVADGIRHLLVDEFQDTSRRQHQLLAGLIAAWPEREGRTLFAVGDPMQSIYFFRDADAELFPRVKQIGLEIPNADAFLPHYVPLSANFRTTPQLVRRLNEAFAKVFASEDGSGVRFAEAMPARDSRSTRNLCFELHLNFAPQAASKKSSTALNSSASETPAAGQLSQIVDLIRSYQPEIDEARAAGKKFRVAVLARTRKSLAQIAAALHEAAIPFRAVDLEKLAARPEVLDALALARALLNPLDRAAWLGVLRAPWCGLSLADLHLLTSADDAALQSRTIPELLAERLPLLSGSGRAAAQRVLSALAGTDTVKEKNPTATLGTWLQQAWTRLGGPDCWNATACANLDLLWRRLDRLSAGEQDLLGPTLDAALDNLTALPDPQAAIDCGVQLMTIHKSKGLEFEVVIVPDLQARDGASSQKLLSWLERGLKPGFDSDELNLEGSEITEFLIAPLPSKGVDKGNAKAWVDAEYKKREVQEARRILYVAATRAREELHLFACPSYKEDANGAMNLANPCGLLSTAWPALEEETRRRFEEWKSTRQADARTEDSASGSSIGEIAASAESNLLFMPSDVRMAARMPARPTLLRRLPIDYRDSASRGLAIAGAEDGSSDCQAHSIAAPLEAAGADRFARHEGGTLSRALGTAVHALLEELAHLRESHEGPNALAALKLRRPRIEARMRASGISGRKAEEIAWEAFQIVVDVLRHAHGEWILSPHLNAANEARWSGVVDGTVRAVQADRVFQAGVAPLSEGDEAWWIIDYKTHAGISNTDAASSLPQLRALFAPQLQAYARVLRNLHGPNAAVRGGLYYPRLLALDWWEL